MISFNILIVLQIRYELMRTHLDICRIRGRCPLEILAKRQKTLGLVILMGQKRKSAGSLANKKERKYVHIYFSLKNLFLQCCKVV